MRTVASCLAWIVRVPSGNTVDEASPVMRTTFPVSAWVLSINGRVSGTNCQFVWANIIPRGEARPIVVAFFQSPVSFVVALGSAHDQLKTLPSTFSAGEPT